jgi:hypothetical protein
VPIQGEPGGLPSPSLQAVFVKIYFEEGKVNGQTIREFFRGFKKEGQGHFRIENAVPIRQATGKFLAGQGRQSGWFQTEPHRVA